MPVIASQRVLFLIVGGLCKPDTLHQNKKGNWSGTTVRSVLGPSRLHVWNEKVFLILTIPVGMIPTTYKENWHGTFRSTNPG